MCTGEDNITYYSFPEFVQGNRVGTKGSQDISRERNITSKMFDDMAEIMDGMDFSFPTKNLLAIEDSKASQIITRDHERSRENAHVSSTLSSIPALTTGYG